MVGPAPMENRRVPSHCHALLVERGGFFEGTGAYARNNVWFQTLLCMRALRNKAPMLNRDLQRGIGEKLRAMYGEMMEDHIPSRHLHLLQRFERDEASGQVAVHQMFPNLEKIGKY
jgi:hypothetical protein